jgi:hypothetical protein
LTKVGKAAVKIGGNSNAWCKSFGQAALATAGRGGKIADGINDAN